MLGEEQRVPADATPEIEYMLRSACLQHRHQRCHRRVRHKPIGAALWCCPPLVPRLYRRRHLRLSVVPSAALPVIIRGKLRYASRKWSPAGEGYNVFGTVSVYSAATACLISIR